MINHCVLAEVGVELNVAQSFNKMNCEQCCKEDEVQIKLNIMVIRM